MLSQATTPAEHVSELINGFWAAQVVNAAALLDLPDRLAQGPATAETLAAAAGAHPPSLFRLLRAMQTLGLCTAGADGVFALTEAGQLLRAGAPGSMRGRALFTGDMLWKQFGDLPEIVRTGGRAASVASGAEGFAALEADPARLEAFQQAMAESSRTAARQAIAAYDFARFGSVLDLGGGYGGVLAELLKANPGQSGAVCDLGYLQAGAEAYLAAAGVAERGRFIPGDFFTAVPAGFDCCLMKFIIHDWDDEASTRILSTARAAAGPATTLALIEQVVPESLGQSLADQAVIRSDLTMMSVGGKERTAAEYRRLLEATGWRLSAVAPAGPSFSVLEALPA